MFFNDTGRGIRQDYLSIREKLSLVSWFFILLVTLTASVGFLSLYSAAGGSMEPWAGKQIARYLFGISGLVLVAMIDIRIWLKLAYPLYILSFLALIYVEARGHIGMGAQRWINIGFMTLQPSEIMKIATVMALARFFHFSTQEDVKNPFMLIMPIIIAVAPAGLVMLQPDLGTAVTILVVSAAIFFLAGVSYWMFVAAISAAVAAMPVAWHFLHDYQRKRILVFLDPDKDPLGSGYHIIQSKIALGSGGITGKGFLQGSQSRLNFLPEKQTDFIFTLFTEEWGMIGAVMLLLLFASIIIYGYFISLNCQNQFGRVLSMGVIVNFFVYIFINIGMVMGLMPVVGVPLPLISYGGTVMWAVLFGFGLMMSAHVHRDVRFS